MKNLLNHIELDFLKSLTYQEINNIINELNDKIKDLESKPDQETSWIKCADRLPPTVVNKEGGVITTDATTECICYDGENVFIDYYDHDGSGFHPSITHFKIVSKTEPPKQ